MQHHTTPPTSPAPTLLLGDCREQMRTLADNSIDSIVTDPPYSLGFMGVAWDTFRGKNGSPRTNATFDQVGGNHHPTCAADQARTRKSGNAKFQESMTPIFAEALRVAKPGAHLLAFGGTRTYHRLACAIEDAGWEIRDCIFWCHGQGFPKGQNVSKQVEALLKTGKTNETEAAKAWDGWNTQLKPAVEPIVVARKPLEGTVAANVLKYGTGAINIDACRVPTETPISIHSPARKTLLDSGHKDLGTWENSKNRFPANLIHDGSDEVLERFPDNVKGGTWQRTDKARHFNNNGEATNCVCTGKDTSIGSAARFFNSFRDGEASADRRYTAEGSTNFAMKPGMRRPAEDTPARFFYCAKASRSERGAGNDHCTVKPLALMRWLITLVTAPGGTVLDPFMGSGTTGVAARQLNRPFVGIERDPHYFEIAKSRVLGELPPFDPPKSKPKTPRAPANSDGRTAFDLSPAPTPQGDGTPTAPKPVQETLF